MKKMLMFALCLAGAWMSGCSGVSSLQPVGLEPVELKSEDWEGTWRNSDGEIRLRIVDSKQGILAADWDEKELDDGMRYDQIFIRKYEDICFASIAEKSEEKASQFLFARIQCDDNLLLIWLPEMDRFEQLVKDARLPGSKENSWVILQKLEKEHYLVFKSDASCNLFEYTEPMAFFKIVQ